MFELRARLDTRNNHWRLDVRVDPSNTDGALFFGVKMISGVAVTTPYAVPSSAGGLWVRIEAWATTYGTKTLPAFLTGGEVRYGLSYLRVNGVAVLRLAQNGLLVWQVKNPASLTLMGESFIIMGASGFTSTVGIEEIELRVL